MNEKKRATKKARSEAKNNHIYVEKRHEGVLT